MRIATIRLSVFLVLTAACVGQQTQQPGVSVGGAALYLNMERQEALKKLSLCCQTVPFGILAPPVCCFQTPFAGAFSH
jgi:hypothetical protein